MSDLLFTRHDYGNARNLTDEGKEESDHALNVKNHTGIDTIVIINCALNVPLMFLSILGNSLVLAAIIRTPSIRSNSMIMQSCCFRSSCWRHSSTAFSSQRTYQIQQCCPIPSFRNNSGFVLWNFVRYNNHHHLGSIYGPSLSHEISSVGY